MNSHFQFVHGLPRAVRSLVCAGAFLALAMFYAAASTLAQGAASEAPEIVAHVQGADVSINGSLLTKASTLVSVANGNVVTVHSGEATMRLVDGGEVSVCGPAKFTVLASDGTVTLALEFGRMHVELPAAVSLKVLTPSIVATPIDIQGGKRDLIVGLDQNDSMCVLASVGAVQLEQELSGERLIVPESGDFALQSGQLTPVVDTGQSCKCAAVPQIVPGTPEGPAPESAIEAPPTVPEASRPTSAPPQQPMPESYAPVEVGVLARANENHPVAAPQVQQAAEPPPTAPADERIVLPPMIFSASSPNPPDVPTEETAALVREVHADPDWQFSGHVESPGFAQAMSRALGEGGASGRSSVSSGNPPAQKKPSGFWASLKRVFS